MAHQKRSTAMFRGDRGGYSLPLAPVNVKKKIKTMPSLEISADVKAMRKRNVKRKPPKITSTVKSTSGRRARRW